MTTASDTLAHDDPPLTKAEQAETLGNLCHRAKREFPTVGVPGPPSAWDIRHAAINRHLCEWQDATD